MDGDTVAAEAARLAAALEMSRAGGWRYVTLDTAPPCRTAIMNAVCPHLIRLGFVVVPSRRAPTPDAIARVAGRHVAIIARDDVDRHHARAWIRALGARSPRSHVVIDLEASMSSPFMPSAHSQMTRAGRALKRGRGASAERWLRAAMASAARRKDDGAQARAAVMLSKCLVARECPFDAIDVAREALARVREDHARADLAAALASALLAAGELRAAEAAIGQIAADAHTRGTPLGVVDMIRGELQFWRGEFADASRMCGRFGQQFAIVPALTAWARADAEALAAEARAPVLPRLWQTAFAGLHASLTGNTAGAHKAARALRQSAFRGVQVGEGRLLRAVACELFLSLDRRDDALAVLGPTHASARGPTLLDRLHRWLRTRCGAAEDRDLDVWIARAGARSFARWGGGKTRMHVLHVLPALLRIIEGAEDDEATLRGGCQWLCDRDEGSAAAFVTLEGHLLAVSDSWHQRSPAQGALHALIAEAQTTDGPVATDEAVAAPVRYAGVLTGVVLAAKSRPDVEGLAEAAAAVAALCGPAVRTRLDALRLRRDGSSLTPDILGVSQAVVSLREAVVRAAGTPFPVLIEGESGTGKELVARALHRLSARRDRRFCPVNCAAISDDLLETELFGHTRGAFTGAAGVRVGLFEEAHGGTIFLDEVAELSARAQAKLLRVLQEREVRRVGENAARPIDVRVIAATNSSLAAMVGQQAFRHDLLFRLAVVRIRVPPLAARLEDVPLLAQAFWRTLAPGTGTQATLGPDALAELSRHRWPGNVRELQNVVSALLVLAPARGRVGARHVQQVLADTGQTTIEAPRLLGDARQSFERHQVAAALARNGGRRSTTARELGMSRQGLVKAIKRLGLRDPPDEAGVA